MRFLVDMPLSPELAAWLREQGHDAHHAAEVGLERAADADIIALAHEEGRTIVTADLDYPPASCGWSQERAELDSVPRWRLA